jgi:hypothetical protein
MRQTDMQISSIPVLLIDSLSHKVFLFVHGKSGNKEEAITFAKIACKKGYQVL